MMNTEIRKYMNRSVLVWLATASKNNQPNVSPKEIFTHYKDDNILIANIASPQSVKNIKENPKVCLSFVDILVQKGFQLKGSAEIITKKDADFEVLQPLLMKQTKGQFPFASIIKITVENAKEIIAPKYLLYPDTTEQEQIESAKKAYGF